MKIPSIRTLRRYHRIARVGEIARRYFAMNAFDGVLTILGVLVGGYFGHVRDAGAIVTLGMAASFAMGVSGFYGTYMIERAERSRSLAELEESTLTDLKDTDIGHASVYASIFVAMVDGFSPFVAAAIAVSPFFLGSSIAIEEAFYISFALVFAELFGLGVFLGAISRERIIFSGLKMVTAGIVIAIIGYLLGTTS
ncbi:MAG: VIT1/CCC1 transporter family protein [Thermoleophilia bacterium]